MEKETTQDLVRVPAEILFAEELSALESNDEGKKPPSWRLSPKGVKKFILGSDGEELEHQWKGKPCKTNIEKKFYGDDTLIERSIVTLLGERGLLLVGEPGTAKSMLSELLAAAISGNSSNTVQGTAGVTEDQIKYSWNYALLLAEGPSMEALVPSPIFSGLNQGAIVRFEELTRCAPEIQDSLISIMSDKVMLIPELGDEKGVLFAQKGFNIIATANIRDRGVHEMSSALKRRFNFETVNPIADKELELELVTRQTERHLSDVNAEIDLDRDVVDLLVTTFHDLRKGTTEEGTVIDKPSTIMSTAEAVSVGFSAALDSHYLGSGKLAPENVVRQLVGTVLKDDPEDAKKLKQYFEVVVKVRSRKSQYWKQYYDARKWLKA